MPLKNPRLGIALLSLACGAGLLAGAQISRLPHEQIIGKLDAAGKTFQVLLLKTNMTIPYTSVFFELECGYWDAASEKRLRELVPAK